MTMGPEPMTRILWSVGSLGMAGAPRLHRGKSAKVLTACPAMRKWGMVKSRREGRTSNFQHPTSNIQLFESDEAKTAEIKRRLEARRQVHGATGTTAEAQRGGNWRRGPRNTRKGKDVRERVL